MGPPADATPVSLVRFERGDIPLDQWNHRAHVTIAYLYLRSRPFDAAVAAMRTGIQAYNRAKGLEPDPPELERGYHETLTLGWMRVLHTTMTVHGPESDAAAFLDKHPYLLNRTLLRLFYSRPRIVSWEAKRHFVEPDLAPLPWPPGEPLPG